MITLFIFIASALFYAGMIAGRAARQDPQKKRATAPAAPDPQKLAADRSAVLDSIAYYDTQLARLYEMIDAAKLDLIAARRAAAEPAPTEKTAARRRAELDKALRRVVTIERSIYATETARNKAAARLDP